MLVREFYRSYPLEKILPDYKPNFIIDAGANIGLSAMYFSRKFPTAKVIAIEPEKTNFESLCFNIGNNYPMIVKENKALWFEKTKLSLSNPKSEKYAFVFNEFSSEEMVETITVQEIIDYYNIERIGILKIDIEGAEKQIFSNECKWLDKVDILMIELHDFSNKGCSKAFYRKILQYDFSQALNYENVIMVNERILDDFRKKNSNIS